MAVKPTSEFDDQSRAMLFDGASISQLATLFGYDNRTVTKRIFGLKPCGKRQGHPVYSVREAAPYLVDPIGDIEAHIKKMNHRDLPPLLLKEFWNGQMARLKFEKEQGYHWPTDEVHGHFASVFQTFRTRILLAVDLVEREAEMTDRQRNACKRILDTLMADIRLELIERFANEPKRSDIDAGAPQNGPGAEGERDFSMDHPALGGYDDDDGDELDAAGRDPSDPAYGL